MEELTVELHVSIEPNGQVGTVEGEGYVGEFFPSLGSMM